MTASCAQGAFGRLAVKAGSGSLDFSSGAVRLPFYREGLRKIGKVVTPDVIVGTRSDPSERARKGPNQYRGPIYFPVSPTEMNTLLPYILGANASGETFAVAETVPVFGVLIDKVTDIFAYQSCYVNRALFRAEQNGPEGAPNFLTLMLEVIGMAEDGTVAEFPSGLALGATAPYKPYIFEDCTVNILSAARTPKAWSVLIDNHLDPRYVNSLNPVLLCPSRRTVAVSATFPYDADHDDLHDYETAAVAGTTGAFVLTNGSYDLTFDFVCLQAPADTPVIRGKTELDITVDFVARSTSTTKEIVVTNDVT